MSVSSYAVTCQADSCGAVFPIQESQVQKTKRTETTCPRKYCDGETIVTVRGTDLSTTPLNSTEFDSTGVWEEAYQFSTELDIETRRRSDGDDEYWYMPTVTPYTAQRAKELFEKFQISTVYDLGAGDCRFSLWCASHGFDTIAYELNPELVEAVSKTFDIQQFEIREKDYRDEFSELVGPDSAVVAFGGTNPLPRIPDDGLAIEGYSEINIYAFRNRFCEYLL